MMLVSGDRNSPCQQPTIQCPDFEVAVLRAVTAVFGRHINHQGCFYHLTQASWRQIQQLGLVPLYKNEDTAVPATSLNGTRMVYSYLNGCGATEKIPSMKMKKVWALANLSKLY
jgi:hypothetical protein